MQDDDSDARQGEGSEETWTFFEASLALLAATAPLLLFDLLRAVAVFVPVLGPTVEVRPGAQCEERVTM